ncbi:hypothetical protein EAH87_07145 [Sphingomonas koreensis]|nr:hypothetical protein EAH87_07145 [Sphingomonas koreensis]
MATAAPHRLHPIVRDRLFFFVMALAIAATAISGFSLQLAMGRSSFHAPWWVHVHGLTFMGWLGLYLVQNWLAWRGSVIDHQRLGRFAAAYVGWMVLVGVSVNTLATIHHRIPPFFEVNVFLVMDWTIVLVFAGLTWAAVRLRGASDWHRRLMLSGAIQVMVPGVARLLPLPLLGGWMLWGIGAALLPFMAAAVIYDLRMRGKVHRAYYWGFGAILLGLVLIRPIAFSPPLLALTHYLTA